VILINRLIMEITMSMEIEDYTSDESAEGNTHYNGVPSFYGKIVESQNKMQPNYCEPGAAGGEMHGEKRNEQAGP
jgi:hypothetical protein